MVVVVVFEAADADEADDVGDNTAILIVADDVAVAVAVAAVDDFWRCSIATIVHKRRQSARTQKALDKRYNKKSIDNNNTNVIGGIDGGTSSKALDKPYLRVDRQKMTARKADLIVVRRLIRSQISFRFAYLYFLSFILECLKSLLLCLSCVKWQDT